MLWGNKEIIGLDIGSSSVKIAEIKLSRQGGYQLKNIGEAFLPHGAIINKAIVNSDPVVDAISNLVNDLKIKTKNAVISISGHFVNIKKVSLPQMNERELREAIPWELDQYMPHSIEDVNYDFQILPGETPEGNMDVLIVAAKKDVTSGYISLVSDAGLNPIVVDVDVFALENMYEMNYNSSNGVVALVNIGASVTNINILKDGFSVFTRDVSIGGREFTDWIQREFSVDYEEAEEMKLSLGSAEVSPDLDRLAHDFIDLVSGEIKRTLEFFSKTLWKEEVDKVVLGGGSSKVPQIKERLEQVTGATVEMVNPFKNITFSDKDFDPEYIRDIAPKMGVVVGLALRWAE
ncbi:MAG TPA: type IV pilus assembly protein PilM [Thermodesulfobacteriota bacterium]|nr:type IV pilus assembly protein PilM [Thermodesulfobacteriota bacterium]